MISTPGGKFPHRTVSFTGPRVLCVAIHADDRFEPGFFFCCRVSETSPVFLNMRIKAANMGSLPPTSDLIDRSVFARSPNTKTFDTNEIGD